MLDPRLSAALDRETARIPTDDLRSEVARLMTAYRQDRSVSLDSPLAAIAYANYRMPGTYAAVTAALAHARSTIPSLEPRSLLDFGGGTGAGLWAATASFGTVETAKIFDSSRHALALAERLFSAAGIEVTTEFTSTGSRPPFPPSDLALSAYVLGEMPEVVRTETTQALFAAAETVVIVEPGTTPGYRRILKVREMALDAGLSVAAPCPHDAPCPLTGQDWCHFAARFPRPPLLRTLKGAEHPYEDEKYAYLAVTRLPVRCVGGRVIRHPQKRSGLVMLEVCEGEGTANRVTVSKRQGEVYRRARRTAWGDEWG